MGIKSQWSLEYPTCSLPTLLFKSPSEKLPQDPSIIDAENTEHFLSLSSYRLVSQQFATGLRSNGFKTGDRLLLFSGNSIYFPTVMMGTIMAGGIFSGANPAYKAAELAYQLKNSGAKFLLCSSNSLSEGIAAASQVGLSTDRVFYFSNSTEQAGPVNQYRHWSALLAPADTACGFQWSQCSTRDDMDQTIVLNYSSGTTGLPKGVEITHRNYVCNSLIQNFMYDLKESKPEQIATTNMLCYTPMYHALAQTYYGISSPLRGVKTYVMPQFDLVRMQENIAKFRISHLIFVPPIVVAMAKHPEIRKWKWDLSSVRDLFAGAAPLGRPASEELESLWKGRPQEGTISVRQGWGLTELTATGTTFDPRRLNSKACVGELVPSSEARIIKEDGTEAGIGESGEIWYRGLNVMRGYWNNPKATQETKTKDGWLITGDIGYFDKDGDLFIVDRKKELIKVKGNQVAPAELEALLLNHPAILDVAVIGVPFEGDEAPRAYVVADASKRVTERDIHTWTNERISRNKQLRGGIRFIDAIPKNPSGKILRKELREKAKAEPGPKL